MTRCYLGEVSDPHAYGPVYRRIAADVRARILDGSLAPGDPVTEPALMAEHGVARGTARQAIDVLRQEGLVAVEHGRSGYVRQPPKVRRQSKVWYDRETNPGSPTARMVSDAGGVSSWDRTSRRSVADAKVAERLGIAEGDPVMRSEYVFRFDGEPFKLSTSWEPLAITGGTAIEEPDVEPGPSGVVARFDSIGVRIETSDEVVAKRPPTEYEARLLGVPQGREVLTIERSYATADGTVVETADIVLGPGYELHYGIPVR